MGAVVPSATVVQSSDFSSCATERFPHPVGGDDAEGREIGVWCDEEVADEEVGAVGGLWRNVPGRVGSVVSFRDVNLFQVRLAFSANR